MTTDLKTPHHTHSFSDICDPEGGLRCIFCDCRPYGKWGHLPCFGE